jgi:hypothetical protein
MLELDSHSLIHVAQTSLRVVKQPVKHYVFSAKCKAQRARRKGQSVALLFALCSLLFPLCVNEFPLSQYAGRTGEFFDLRIRLESSRAICVEDRLDITSRLIGV